MLGVRVITFHELVQGADSAVHIREENFLNLQDVIHLTHQIQLIAGLNLETAVRQGVGVLAPADFRDQDVVVLTPRQLFQCLTDVLRILRNVVGHDVNVFVQPFLGPLTLGHVGQRLFVQIPEEPGFQLKIEGRHYIGLAHGEDGDEGDAQQQHSPSTEDVVNRDKSNICDGQHVQQGQNHQRRPVGFAVQPQLGKGGVPKAQHRPGKNRDDNVHQQAGGDAGEFLRHNLKQGRMQQAHSRDGGHQHDDAVQEKAGKEVSNHHQPVVGVVRLVLLAGGVPVDFLQELFRQVLSHKRRYLGGIPDEHRGGQGCEHGSRYNNRVEVFIHHPQGNSQRRDDIGKFSDWSQTESTLQGGFHPLTGKDHTQCGKNQLGNHRDNRNRDDGGPVFRNHGRIHLHAHGNEENHGEHILNALGCVLHFLRMVGSREEGSRQECSQLHGEPKLFRQESQGEADSQRQGDEHLPVEKVHDAVQQGREEVNPNN